MADDLVHIGSDLNLGGAVRNAVASTFGLAADLPESVTTGCGHRVPMASTSRLPDTVTCPPCRDYAHRKYLEHADNIELLDEMPGLDISATQIAEAVLTSREMAMRFLEPGGHESGPTGTESS